MWINLAQTGGASLYRLAFVLVRAGCSGGCFFIKGRRSAVTNPWRLSAAAQTTAQIVPPSSTSFDTFSFHRSCQMAWFSIVLWHAHGAQMRSLIVM